MLTGIPSQDFLQPDDRVLVVVGLVQSDPHSMGIACVEIVEWDQIYDDDGDWTWGDADVGGSSVMDFLNIAVHEMGHNVEQTISLNDIDHVMLQGVPNTAFTEALAFVFQARDLELLGLDAPDEEALALRALDDYWGAAEIGAVALVDIAVWRWMYDHPEATAAEPDTLDTWFICIIILNTVTIDITKPSDISTTIVFVAT